MSPDQAPDDQRRTRPAAGPRCDAQSDIRRRLLAAQPGRPRKAALLRHLTDLAAEVIDIPPSAVDPTAPLATLGLTSAGILEIRARLESSLQLTLPATLGWRFPTLDALASHLAERLGADEKTATSQAQASIDRNADLGSSVRDRRIGDRSDRPVATGPARIEDDPGLDELSEEELAAHLTAKIEQIGDAERR